MVSLREAKAASSAEVEEIVRTAISDFLGGGKTVALQMVFGRFIRNNSNERILFVVPETRVSDLTKGGKDNYLFGKDTPVSDASNIRDNGVEEKGIIVLNEAQLIQLAKHHPDKIKDSYLIIDEIDSGLRRNPYVIGYLRQAEEFIRYAREGYSDYKEHYDEMKRSQEEWVTTAKLLDKIVNENRDNIHYEGNRGFKLRTERVGREKLSPQERFDREHKKLRKAGKIREDSKDEDVESMINALLEQTWKRHDPDFTGHENSETGVAMLDNKGLIQPDTVPGSNHVARAMVIELARTKGRTVNERDFINATLTDTHNPTYFSDAIRLSKKGMISTSGSVKSEKLQLDNLNVQIGEAREEIDLTEKGHLGLLEVKNTPDTLLERMASADLNGGRLSLFSVGRAVFNNVKFRVVEENNGTWKRAGDGKGKPRRKIKTIFIGEDPEKPGRISKAEKKVAEEAVKQLERDPEAELNIVWLGLSGAVNIAGRTVKGGLDPRVNILRFESDPRAEVSQLFGRGDWILEGKRNNRFEVNEAEMYVVIDTDARIETPEIKRAREALKLEGEAGRIAQRKVVEDILDRIQSSDQVGKVLSIARTQDVIPKHELDRRVKEFLKDTDQSRAITEMNRTGKDTVIIAALAGDGYKNYKVVERDESGGIKKVELENQVNRQQISYRTAAGEMTSLPIYMTYLLDEREDDPENLTFESAAAAKNFSVDGLNIHKGDSIVSVGQVPGQLMFVGGTEPDQRRAVIHESEMYALNPKGTQFTVLEVDETFDSNILISEKIMQIQPDPKAPGSLRAKEVNYTIETTPEVARGLEIEFEDSDIISPDPQEIVRAEAKMARIRVQIASEKARPDNEYDEPQLNRAKDDLERERASGKRKKKITPEMIGQKARENKLKQLRTDEAKAKRDWERKLESRVIITMPVDTYKEKIELNAEKLGRDITTEAFLKQFQNFQFGPEARRKKPVTLEAEENATRKEYQEGFTAGRDEARRVEKILTSKRLVKLAKPRAFAFDALAYGDLSSVVNILSAGSQTQMNQFQDEVKRIRERLNKDHLALQDEGELAELAPQVAQRLLEGEVQQQLARESWKTSLKMVQETRKGFEDGLDPDDKRSNFYFVDVEGKDIQNGMDIFIDHVIDPKTPEFDKLDEFQQAEVLDARKIFGEAKIAVNESLRARIKHEMRGRYPAAHGGRYGNTKNVFFTKELNIGAFYQDVGRKDLAESATRKQNIQWTAWHELQGVFKMASHYQQVGEMKNMFKILKMLEEEEGNDNEFADAEIKVSDVPELAAAQLPDGVSNDDVFNIHTGVVKGADEAAQVKAVFREGDWIQIKDNQFSYELKGQPEGITTKLVGKIDKDGTLTESLEVQGPRALLQDIGLIREAKKEIGLTVEPVKRKRKKRKKSKPVKREKKIVRVANIYKGDYDQAIERLDQREAYQRMVEQYTGERGEGDEALFADGLVKRHRGSIVVGPPPDKGALAPQAQLPDFRAPSIDRSIFSRPLAPLVPKDRELADTAMLVLSKHSRENLVFHTDPDTNVKTMMNPGLDNFRVEEVNLTIPPNGSISYTKVLALPTPDNKRLQQILVNNNRIAADVTIQSPSNPDQSFDLKADDPIIYSNDRYLVGYKDDNTRTRVKAKIPFIPNFQAPRFLSLYRFALLSLFFSPSLRVRP